MFDEILPSQQQDINTGTLIWSNILLENPITIKYFLSGVSSLLHHDYFFQAYTVHTTSGYS